MLKDLEKELVELKRGRERVIKAQLAINRLNPYRKPYSVAIFALIFFVSLLILACGGLWYAVAPEGQEIALVQSKRVVIQPIVLENNTLEIREEIRHEVTKDAVDYLNTILHSYNEGEKKE